jgi:hypothetical protein
MYLLAELRTCWSPGTHAAVNWATYLWATWSSEKNRTVILDNYMWANWRPDTHVAVRCELRYLPVSYLEPWHVWGYYPACCPHVCSPRARPCDVWSKLWTRGSPCKILLRLAPGHHFRKFILTSFSYELRKMYVGISTLGVIFFFSNNVSLVWTECMWFEMSFDSGW